MFVYSCFQFLTSMYLYSLMSAYLFTFTCCYCYHRKRSRWRGMSANTELPVEWPPNTWGSFPLHFTVLASRSYFFLIALFPIFKFSCLFLFVTACRHNIIYFSLTLTVLTPRPHSVLLKFRFLFVHSCLSSLSARLHSPALDGGLINASWH